MESIRHREVSKVLSNGQTLDAQGIDFTDKKVLFLRLDGEVDTTFDVHCPDPSVAFELQNQQHMDDFTCDKVCLIGDNLNIKMSLLVNHISKFLYSNGESRNMIISLSSKTFSRTGTQGDFDRLLEVLELVKQVV